jgi:uncharacterized protein
MKIGQFSLPYQGLLMVLLIAGCVDLVLINPVMAQEKILRTLTVTGNGIKRIPTTLTQVQLGVEIEAKTATQVQQEVAKRTSAVVDFLRSRQVERLETTGISLQPNYQYNNNQRSLLGYIGTNTVTFRLETEAVGSLLDEAVKMGATRIDQISFTATEEAISAAQKEALSEATIDAQQQANAVLGTLNFTTKEVVSIQINGANATPPQPYQTQKLAAEMADAPPPSTPIIGGEQIVQAFVTLEISY